MFLKHILDQKHSALIKRFLLLQFENPTKGDWASMCLNDFKLLQININIDDIQQMTKRKFKNLIYNKSDIISFNYLLVLRKSKGKEIIYTQLEMSSYLLPGCNLSRKQKQQLFSIRNRMIYIHMNFKSMDIDTDCVCGQLETIEHIYQCSILKTVYGLPYPPYNNIYSENVNEQLEVYNILHLNLDKRSEYSELFEDKMKKKRKSM